MNTPTQQGSHSYLMEKSKALQTSKAKKIRQHPTSSTRNPKGTSLDGKEKAPGRNKNIMSGKTHQ